MLMKMATAYLMFRAQMLLALLKNYRIAMLAMRIY